MDWKILGLLVSIVVMAILWIKSIIDCGVIISTLGMVQAEHSALIDRWNELAKDVNDKGGRDFLNSGKVTSNLSTDDVKRLRILTHPDAHQDNRKVLAEKMFKMLEGL